MDARISSHKWSNKITISKEAGLICAVVIAAIIAFFKVKPYFNEHSNVVVYKDVQTVKSEEEKSSAAVEMAASHIEMKELPKQRAGQFAGYSVPKSGERKSTLIERPLFDGLPVLIKAQLLNGISSKQTDKQVELKILSLKPLDKAAELDSTSFIGSRLLGQLLANLQSKRIEMRFNELISTDGRSYGVAAVALDLESNSLGAPADYSSGLPFRLLGVAIDRGINAADQIAMAKFLEKTTNDQSQVGKEIQRASIETNQQAAMNLSAETTKELRETPAELSLDAGTIIHVRLRALQTGVAQ